MKLGLFPGWGGIAKTPRMIGLSNALELITQGDPISGPEAVKQGLAEVVTSSEQLLEAAIALIAEENQTEAFQQDRIRNNLPIEITPNELMFLGATASAYVQQQTKGKLSCSAGGNRSDACRGEC